MLLASFVKRVLTSATGHAPLIVKTSNMSLAIPYYYTQNLYAALDDQLHFMLEQGLNQNGYGGITTKKKQKHATFQI